jgi:hypothetical protein
MIKFLKELLCSHAWRVTCSVINDGLRISHFKCYWCNKEKTETTDVRKDKHEITRN